MTNEQEKLLRFMEGKGTDNNERTIKDIWNLSIWQLEYIHNYIQWLFPTRKESEHAYSVPLTDEMIEYIKNSKEIKTNLLTSFKVILDFYGFKLVNKRKIVAVKSLKEMIFHWCNFGNHNFLRITRILESLNELGYDDLAKEWLDVLLATVGHEIYVKKSIKYWHNAVYGD